MSLEYRRRRLAIGVVLLVNLLGIGLLCGRHLFHGREFNRAIEALRKSGYPVEVEDMAARRPPIRDSNNAAIELSEAFNSLDHSFDVSLLQAWIREIPTVRGANLLSSETEASMRRYIEANQAAWDAVQRAVKLRECRFPVDVDISFGTPVPHLRGLKRIAELGCVRAGYFRAQRQSTLAVEAVESTLGLATLTGKDPLGHSQRLKYWMQSRMLWIVEWLVNDAALTDSELARVENALVASLDLHAFQQALQTEFYITLKFFRNQRDRWEMIKSVSRVDSIRTHFSMIAWELSGQFNSDGLYFLDQMERVIEASNQPFAFRVSAAHEVQRNFKALGKPRNPFAFPILSSLCVPTLAQWMIIEAEASARLGVTCAGIGAERFRRAHRGKLPASLNEVESAIPSELRIDPFNNQPLRYRLASDGARIYSVGPDGSDDGGLREAEAGGGGHDLGFRLRSRSIPPELH